MFVHPGALALAVALSAPSPSPSPSALPRIGQVVTSDRQTEPASAATRTTFVVTKDELVREGWNNVGEAIEDVPGVMLVRYGALGAQISAEIRGASSNQVLVLLDGQPVPGTQLGGVDLAMYSTTGVERIEVVEGPSATLYGSGAAGGVINIITTRGAGAYASGPAFDLEGGSYADAQLAVESRWLSYQQQSAVNDYPYTLPDGTTGVRTNADYDNLVGSLNFAGALGAVRFNAGAGISSRELGVPGSVDAPTFGERQNDGNSNVLATFTLPHPGSTVSLDVSAQRERINAIDEDPADFATVGSFNATSVEARAQLSLRDVVASAASRLVYGVDLAHIAVRNDDGLGDIATDDLAQTALYAQESLRVGGATLSAGLRGERDGPFGGALTPSLGAAIGLGPNLRLQLNGGTGFRAPTADELYFPNFGNPNLQPERTTQYEVTLSAPQLAGGASVAWFVQNGQDLITYDATLNTDVNLSQTSVAGFVFNLATPSLNGLVTNLNLTDTYRALDLTSVAVRLTYRPVIVANLDLTYLPTRRSALDAIGVIAHVQGLSDPTGALPFTRIDAYVRLHLGSYGVLSLRGYNLGNEQYQPVAGYPAPGRSFLIGLSTR